MDNLKENRKLYAFELGFLLVSLFIIILLVYGNFQLKENFFQGFSNIITSQAGLITDFLMVGGLSAGFSNSLLILAFNYFIVRFLKIEIKGMVLASTFYCFWIFFFWKKHIKYSCQYI